MDGFPDDLREVVHEHWGTFPPQNPMIVDLFGIMFFFLFFFAFCGNCFVIYVFLSKKSLRTAVSTIFISEIRLHDNQNFFFRIICSWLTFQFRIFHCSQLKPCQ